MRTISYLALTITLGVLSACATPPKEHTAPCKRPANALGYIDDPRSDCGPMHSVNDPERAMATILTLENQ